VTVIQHDGRAATVLIDHVGPYSQADAARLIVDLIAASDAMERG
jgi:hypothetical protein